MKTNDKKKILELFQNLADEIFNKYGPFPPIESKGYLIRYKK